MTDAPEKLLYDAGEAAAACGVSRSTWYSMWSAGETPEGIKLGKQRKWSVVELKAWVAAGCPPRSIWLQRVASQAARDRLAALKSA